MKKILLIEDNKGITEGLCDTFTEPEYELLTAGISIGRRSPKSN